MHVFLGSVRHLTEAQILGTSSTDYTFRANDKVPIIGEGGPVVSQCFILSLLHVPSHTTTVDLPCFKRSKATNKLFAFNHSSTESSSFFCRLIIYFALSGFLFCSFSLGEGRNQKNGLKITSKKKIKFYTEITKAKLIRDNYNLEIVLSKLYYCTN